MRPIRRRKRLFHLELLTLDRDTLAHRTQQQLLHMVTLRWTNSFALTLSIVNPPNVRHDLARISIAGYRRLQDALYHHTLLFIPTPQRGISRSTDYRCDCLRPQLLDTF